MNYALPTLSATKKLAARIAPLLTLPFVLTISGDLGVGKTTFVRAILKALGHLEPVKSPTFSIVETYFLPQGIFHHFDLYRILDPEELHTIGWRDYFSPDAISCIEWPEHAQALLGAVDLALYLTASPIRVMSMKAGTEQGQRLLSHLMG